MVYHWILYSTTHTAQTARAITVSAAGLAARAPPLVIVKDGARTAENVSVLDTTNGPPDCTATLTHVACAPAAPVHTISSSTTCTPPAPGSVTVVASDWLNREASSANVLTMVVGVLMRLVSVDVPFTSASTVMTMVSAYTVSPSACTLREVIPAMDADITSVGIGGPVSVVVSWE
ncbi:hypothetical protein HYPSUDRAFT_49968 [Hypholoma sublateritium FD-334 SS-4]|uniref:Uncharacterized protein n=1 Tax=Hypholoma sublateritium (strain FD-334 SS-4) TaxID=945553 RepID=A0A0D2KFR3_HYPSF|nr:hypothetical protein HYPSUDRAFT_49968 [Hypholoma sublateritium FD-334 SS-4]